MKTSVVVHPEKYTTKYQKMVVGKYLNTLPENDDNADYEKIANFIGIISYPKDYGIEDEMFGYFEENEDCTITEAFKHMCSVLEKYDMI